METTTNASTTPGRLPTVADLAERIDGFTLLAVWAHPDDESYLGAGLMAAVAASGGRVVNVAATLGEHGTDDPVLMPPQRLARIRGAELRTALAALRAADSIVLGYGDGACDQVDDAMGARRIGGIIDSVGPDAVVTFGPDGVTGHPDHIAVGRWTRLAVADRGDRIPLFTTAAAAAWPTDLITRMHEVNAFFPGFPVAHAHPTVHVRVDDGVLGAKLAALAAHRSQIGPMRAELGPEGFRRLASHEAYGLANRAAEALVAGVAAPSAAA